MIWIAGILIGLFVLDALRMRARISGLPVLGASRASADAGAEADSKLLTAPGVELDDATRIAVRAHAAERGLDVIDIIPGDLPTTRALAFAQLVDIPSYRRNRLAPGRTASHAVLVSRDVATRASVESSEVADPVSFVRLAFRLKRYACVTTDLAVARGLRGRADDPRKRLAVMREAIGGATPFILIVQLFVYAALIACVAVPGARLWGAIAVGVFHIQPALVLAATPLRSRDLVWVVLARLPWEIASWMRTVRGGWQRDNGPDPVEERRPAYAELLSRDRSELFEPRRDTCPVCEGARLRVHLRTTDLLQQKPGTFTLERCRDCGHIFQNPRLSIAGLDFYYKDFYDGLGEKGMEFIFGYSDSSYLCRARMLAEVAQPKKWLDVGGGHGHFCCVARDVLPATEFDGLDLSESIDEAVRRRWVDHGYRGLFPDVAPSIAGKYDVVSMSHYLEHTRDPEAELDAARTALEPGGHLLIEVPDPQSPFGKLLRKYWLPWFQPQHQHLLSRGNLSTLLEKHGFTAVEWHRAEAHQRVDFVFALVLLLDRVAPPSDRPWRKPASFAKRAWRGGVWSIGAPLVMLARLVDVLMLPPVHMLGMSNTYRVLARRNP
jgi:SAM-dependent methyltransferase